MLGAGRPSWCGTATSGHPPGLSPPSRGSFQLQKLGNSLPKPCPNSHTEPRDPGLGQIWGWEKGAWKSCSDSIPPSLGAAQGRAEEPGKVFPAHPAPQGGISPWAGHISLGVRVSTEDMIWGVSGCLGSSVSAPPRPKRRHSRPQSMWNISVGHRVDREPLPLYPTPHFGVSRGLSLLHPTP